MPPLTFLGEALIAPEPLVAGDPEIGGLSGIFYIGNDTYYLVSDDRGLHGPARYYEAQVEFSGGRLGADAASITSWTELVDTEGEPLAEGTFDHEGMIVYNGNVFISSEGDARRGVPPSVTVYGTDGRMMERLALPPGFAPTPEGDSGVRNNAAFEALAITPDNAYIFTAAEDALVQDGPRANDEHGSVTRLLRFDRVHGVFDEQYGYEIAAVHATSPEGGLAVTGVVEMLALSADHLLVLERSFVLGADEEQSIKLFDVCLADATDISTVDSLRAATYTPATKRLIADLANLVPHIDNTEGMTFGPTIDGERTLLVVSDNNFATERQVTQMLAFSLSADAIGSCESG